MAETLSPPTIETPAHDAPEPAAESDAAQIDEILLAVTQRLQTQRLPVATYRVQLNAHCTFRDAAALVPYLHELGISDLYSSPFLKARPGSVHGYDVVDHSSINPEIGTAAELLSLRSALREHDMGLIADVVPNHMSALANFNAWWQDVLENGASSPYASFFDIDWVPFKSDLANKVLLPVLGDQFGKILEDGQLVVHYADGAFCLQYFEQRFPLAPGSFPIILAPGVEALQQRLGNEHPELQELLSILTAIRNLPPRTETDPQRLAERRREKEVVKRRLHELAQRSADIAGYIAESVRGINGRVGEPASFDRLDQLLQEQAYRLAFWRVAADEINYRRFFDVNELAAICMEQPAVFAETHKLLFELLEAGVVTGLRIDHPDGLYDPSGYLTQLQEQRFLQLCRHEWERLVDIGSDGQELRQAWPRLAGRLRELWGTASRIPGSPLAKPLYLVVEKILARDETLPEDWPIHGSVGYGYLNELNGLFVDSENERACTVVYGRFAGEPLDFQELAYNCKRLIVKTSMASELTVLGQRLDRISERNRWTRDFTLNSLTRALQEVIASFPVYRTYVQPGRLLERDRHYIDDAVAEAQRRNPAVSESVFYFIRDILQLHYRDNADEEERRAQEGFVGKFQQLTGPIMAKAVEDTACYRFNRLISLNEVGGQPDLFGGGVEEFHQLNRGRLPRWTRAMSGTSTHDTKRSEDVRARIDVLSEIPRAWREKVMRWTRWNRRFKRQADGREAPSRNAEYALYQSLVGTWPGDLADKAARSAYVERIQQHMLKVAREAKVHTSWISPRESYESALTAFVGEILQDQRRQPFLSQLSEFAAAIADHGRWNSLSQTLLKICSPGVPDFYQGTELWTLTLVDPDNRQPVDFASRRTMLDGLLGEMSRCVAVEDGGEPAAAWLARAFRNGSATTESRDAVNQMLQRLLEQRADGRIKLFLTLLGLRARRLLPELFTEGEYEPLQVTGQFARHVVAFVRRAGEAAAIVVAPRLTVGIVGFGGPPPLGDAWRDTTIRLPEDLAARRWGNLFTLEPHDGTESMLCSDVLRQFPAALLVCRSGEPSRTGS